MTGFVNGTVDSLTYDYIVGDMRRLRAVAPLSV